jgi:hypothetical protein
VSRQTNRILGVVVLVVGVVVALLGVLDDTAMAPILVGGVVALVGIVTLEQTKRPLGYINCPYCRELVHVDASVCPHCRIDISD